MGRAVGQDSWIDITVPASVVIEEVWAQEIPGWADPNRIVSREYGNRWFEERRTAVLIIPSLVTQGIERNILINQDHLQFGDISPGVVRSVNWDERLFKR